MELKDLQEIIDRNGRGLKQQVGLVLSEQEAKDIIKSAVSEVFSLHVVSERLNSIDFAKYLEDLTPINRISVHPSPRTLGVDEIYDKYKRQQERNAR